MIKKISKIQLIINKEKYIHLKDFGGNLAATICLLNTNLGPARGISVCSAYDNFYRKTGRHYAKRFAIRALKGRRCIFNKQEVISRLLRIPHFEIKSNHLYYYEVRVEKGSVNPILSNFELSIFSDK